jgi:2-keto-4-pentenoate hydratase/2-oxohepta-3-ene-1,7-dioic acid hydratase in catechol pathway
MNDPGAHLRAASGWQNNREANIMTLWVRYQTQQGEVGFGTLAGSTSGTLADATSGMPAEATVTEYAGDMFAEPHATGRVHALHELRLLSPCQPGKIVALWNNFHALAAKLGKAVPKHPLFLIKPSTSLAGPGQAIRRPPSYAGKIAYEGELGIVIGRRCSAVTPAAAADYIFGYTCINDVTAGELLNEDVNFAQWCRAKGYDTFGCVGPAIATDLDWRAAHVVTTLDGVERQNYALSDMVFSPHEQVSRISHDMTLMPGDVIACGTSLGIGSIKEGGCVAVTIAGVGTLSNVLAG